MKNQLPYLRLGTALMYFFLLVVLTTPAWGARVKDIAALRGARDNELIGFGIVIGLDGTGDSQESLLTRKPIVNALERIGISLKEPGYFRTKYCCSMADSDFTTFRKIRTTFRHYCRNNW